MIRGLFGVLLVAAALAASVSVAGPPAGTLRLCADPDNLPFSSAGSGDRGLYLDLAQMIAARLGVDVEYVWGSSESGARAIRNSLLADRCDAYVGLPYEKGFMGGKVDTVIGTIVDVTLSFPQILLALAFVAALGPSLVTIIVVLGLTG